MKPTIITIAGGTASGKTTIAKAVKKIIENTNSDVSLISLDDYYMDGKEAKLLFEDGIINWDNPITVMWDKLVSDLNKLISGEEIIINKYDYQKDTHTESYTVKPTDNIILEGIFALWNPEIIELSKIKIYVKADADIRIIRRMKRDRADRHGENFDDNKFMNQWSQTLKPSHDKYIAPTQANADFVLNTTSIESELIAKSLSLLIGIGTNK